MLRSLLIALQFLTRLPVRLNQAPTAVERGRSLLFYPAVGLIVGLLLLGLAWLLGGADPWLTAALLVGAWVLVTGVLHIDGLADSADAWLGGHGDPQRTLEIMKDPRSGPAGVAAVVVILLIKFAALATVPRVELWAALLMSPLLARTMVIALFLSTPYLRPQGLGSDLARYLPAAAGWALVGLVVLAVPLLEGRAGLQVVAMAALFTWLLRGLMMKRMGGMTGDTAGALIEVIEMVCLVTLAL